MTTKYFNRNYLAKVYGVNENGERINTLVSLTKFREMFGEFADKFIENFANSGLDSKKFKLRSKTYYVTIYNH